MYSTAAMKPASSSCASVPVSKRAATGSSGAGRTLYGRHERRSSSRPKARPRCGPKNLYGEQRRTSTSSAATSIGPCGAKWTASTHTSAPASCARSATRFASGIVPTAFEASGKATTRVRSVSLRSRSSTSRVVSSWISTKSTRRSRSCASSSHGATLASWSSRVTRISSPAVRVRPSARVSAKLSVVMFAPKIVSSGRQPRKRAAVAWACSTSASLRRLVANFPPRFAFDSRR